MRSIDVVASKRILAELVGIVQMLKSTADVMGTNAWFSKYETLGEQDAMAKQFKGYQTVIKTQMDALRKQVGEDLGLAIIYPHFVILDDETITAQWPRSIAEQLSWQGPAEWRL